MEKVLELTGPVGNEAVPVPAVRDGSRAHGKSRGRSIHRHRVIAIAIRCQHSDSGALLIVPYSAPHSDVP